MTKDEWHPLPEVHEKEIIFQQFQFKDEKYAFFALSFLALTFL